MSIHIVFVAEFSPDAIEVSDRLPADRIMPGKEHLPYPFYQGRKLTRLWVEADEPPVLPDGDISHELLREWASILNVVRVEEVDDKLSYREYDGLCVDLKVAAVETDTIGTVFEAVVTNVGPYPVGLLSVRWETRFAPDPGRNLIGEAFAFVPVGSPLKQLNPGERHTFALTKPELPHCLLHSDTHTSDDYNLSVVAAPPGEGVVHEIHRMSGDELGYMVRKLKEFLRTEVQ